MQEVIHLSYYNPRLNIGFSTWREVNLLQPLQRLYPEVDKGKLVYRARGSKRRVSYEQLNRDLVKRRVQAVEEVHDWLI